MPDVVIVGAGHNGLVAGFYLGRAGMDVLIVEAKDVVGGACVTEELIEGHRFSTCANVVCWLRPEVARDMRLEERGLDFSSPGDRIYHCWQQMTQLYRPDYGVVWSGDADRMRETIGKLSAADVAGWDAWTRLWADAATLFGPFVMQPPPTFRQICDRAERTGMTDLLSRLVTTSIAEFADEHFESFELRNHIRAPIDLGSTEDVGTGLMTAVAEAVAEYSEESLRPPRGYVRGGMGQLTAAMAEAAREVGVGIRLGSPVASIRVRDGRAVGVALVTGEEIDAPVVVSNLDPKRTFLKLLEPDDLPVGLLRRIVGLRTRVAPLKFHCALSGMPELRAFPDSQPPGAGAVLIYPGREYWERAWDDAKYGELPRAPFMEMFTPSAWDDSLAPEGNHTVSFWIQFAPVRLASGTWASRREEMADRLLDLITAYMPNFRTSLIDWVLLTPEDLAEREFLTDGNIHHVDFIPSQALWRRPLEEMASYVTPIGGLYMCGAGMHPYGEVSGAPGHNASQAILRAQ